MGAGFFGFGVLGIYFQILDRAAGDRRLDKRIGKAIRREAPAFSGAVIDSLAFKPETLETIAASDELSTALPPTRLRCGSRTRSSHTTSTPTYGIR